MSVALERLRVRLKMDDTDPQISGAAGEAAAILWFESKSILWMRIDQDKEIYSKALLSAGAKRPDFLIFDEGQALFLDVKTYTPATADDQNVLFCIELDEYRKFDITTKITGIDVGLLFWNKAGFGRFEFALCALLELSEMDLGDGRKRMGKQFPRKEFIAA